MAEASFQGRRVARHLHSSDQIIDPATSQPVDSSGGLTIDNQIVDPSEVTKIISPGAFISGQEATIIPVLSGSGIPHAGENEVQFIVYNELFPITGTFKLSFDGSTTSAIDVHVDTASQVIAKLEALPSIGSGNIQVSGDNTDTFVGNGGEFDFEFIGDLAFQPLPQMTVTNVSLVHNGSPVTDPASFDVDRNEGTLGTPPIAGQASVYVDLDSGTLYVNTGNQLDPTWVMVGPLDWTQIKNLQSREDGSNPGTITVDSPFEPDHGGSTTLGGGRSAIASDATGATVSALGATGSNGGMATMSGGNSVDNDGALIRVQGATSSSDGVILMQTVGLAIVGLPTSLPNSSNQVWNDNGTLKIT